MEIIGSGREKNTLYIAVLALVLMGAALVFSTWRILERQKQTSLEHLELTAIAVLQAVDSSLRRGSARTERFSTDTRDFFRDMQASGDILFVGIINDKGIRLLATGEERAPTVAFPENALGQLARENRWQGQALYGDKKIYVAARRTAAVFSTQHRHRRNTMHMEGSTAFSEAADPDNFLTVAVDMDKHFAAYESFRKTALFQTAYILAAAVFLWLLAARFLSRRKMARKAVYLEQFQARLIDAFPDGLLIVGENGLIRAANPAARAMLAPHGDQVTGLTLATFSLPPLSPPVATGGPTKSATIEDEWRHVTLHGMRLEIRALPLYAENTDKESAAPSLMVILHDRTQIRTLEENLAEAEKLAAIGSLAAGVAHEIRNPLSALRGFAQYFAKKLAGKMPEEEYAATMVREADRLNRVITDLLFLARPRDFSPATVNIATVYHEMEQLMRFELREHGTILSCSLEAETVYADPDALKQALLNLLLNAQEALATLTHDEQNTPGSISITAKPGTASDRHGVWITVSDTGPGMSEDAKKEAFNAFFTTKKKGTGLGLTLVATIMRGHLGETAFANAAHPGTGCSVALFFPDAPSYVLAGTPENVSLNAHANDAKMKPL